MPNSPQMVRQYTATENPARAPSTEPSGISTAPATIAPKKANRCSQPRIRGRVSGWSQSSSSKSSAVQVRSTCWPSSRTAATAGPRGASISAPSDCTRTCSRSSGRVLMDRGYGPVGPPAPAATCEFAVSPAGGPPPPPRGGAITAANRRWARATGLLDPNAGHRRGADRIASFLGWCDEAGVEVVTLFLLSTDNLSRPEPELTPLLRIIEGVVEDLSAPDRRWQLHPVGALGLLPPETVTVLKEAEESTRGRPGAMVNLAVGYGGGGGG